jgi:hypothetical protein
MRVYFPAYRAPLGAWSSAPKTRGLRRCANRMRRQSGPASLGMAACHRAPVSRSRRCPCAYGRMPQDAGHSIAAVPRCVGSHAMSICSGRRGDAWLRPGYGTPIRLPIAAVPRCVGPHAMWIRCRHRGDATLEDGQSLPTKKPPPQRKLRLAAWSVVVGKDPFPSAFRIRRSRWRRPRGPCGPRR